MLCGVYFLLQPVSSRSFKSGGQVNSIALHPAVPGLHPTQSAFLFRGIIPARFFLFRGIIPARFFDFWEYCLIIVGLVNQFDRNNFAINLATFQNESSLKLCLKCATTNIHLLTRSGDY